MIADKIASLTKIISPIIGGAVGFCFGEATGVFIALAAFMVADYISGVLAAVNNKSLSSKIGFIGISKKIAILIMVAIANILDVKVLQADGILRTAVIFFYLANEGLSILENIGRLGLPIPKKISDTLKQLGQEEDNE